MSAGAVQTIRDPEALAALREPWRALWQRSRAATPFQHPAWLIPFVRRFGGAGLVALACHDGPEMTGLGVFMVDDRSGGRVARLAGAPISDYLDVLAATDDAAHALVRALFDRHAVLRAALDDVPEASPLLRLGTGCGLRREVEAQHRCPVVALGGATSAERLASPRLARNLRKARRRAERAGGVTAHRATPDTLDAMLETFFRLHASRWSERGEAGVTAEATIQAFYREAARGLLEDGALRLFELGVLGEPLASVLALSDGRRLYSYLGGFDPRRHHLSPGALALEHVIDHAIAEGLCEFDFLRGAEGYKYDWGAKDRTTYRVTFSSAG